MGRTKMLLIGALALLVLIPIAVIAVPLLFFVKPPDANCSTSSSFVATNVLQGASNGFTAEQLNNGRTILQIIASRSEFKDPVVRQKAGEDLLTGGFTESDLRNVDYGDLDSIGIWQMRPSQGWGTVDQILDVNYATNLMLDRLLAVPNWQNKSAPVVAQEILKSGIPSAYYDDVDRAVSMITLLGPDVSTVTGTCASGSGIDIAAIMAYARGQIGHPYHWGKKADGSGFISAAYAAAGVKLPSKMSGLQSSTSDAATGLTETWIPASDFESGAASPQMADVWLSSNDPNATSRDDATQAALYSTGLTGAGLDPFNIVTYNLRVGLGHEARIQRAKELMTDRGWDIVGFQEVEQAPMYNNLRATFHGSRWAIYPPAAGTVYRNGVQARSIAYNTDRFEFVSASEIQFKRMELEFHEAQPAHAPVLRLRDKLSGQEFYVVNTHSPAYERYAFERKEADDAYVAKMLELQATGLPVFFTGDFNSGYWLRDVGNTTYSNDPAYLTYCRLTKDGLMQDAKDIAEGIANNVGLDGQAGYCPRTQNHSGDNSVDHIYVTPGVAVAEYGDVPTSVTLSDHAAEYARVSVAAAPQSSEPNADGDAAQKAVYAPEKGKFGDYIGPEPGTGVIKEQAVGSLKFLGVLRYQLSQVLEASGPWVNPLGTTPYVITDTYGYEYSGARGGYAMHDGTDLGGVPVGTPVYAAHSGTVWQAADGSASGNQIIVDNGGTFGSGSGTKYEHLDSMVVSAKAQVTAGQLIGYVGATGNATGPHLHFSVCTEITLCVQGSGAGDRGTVDPQPFMRQNGVPL